MSLLTNVLERGMVSRLRRNHALEHATLRILAQKQPGVFMAGYSDPTGFWVVGNVDTEELQLAVDQALARLQGGEHSLAIHPNCGTNFATAGLLAGSLAWLGMLGTGRDFRQKLDRWPLVISLTTLGLMLGQPLGLMIQANVTTQGAVGSLQVIEIMRYQRRDVPLHRVLTRH